MKKKCIVCGKEFEKIFEKVWVKHSDKAGFWAKKGEDVSDIVKDTIRITARIVKRNLHTKRVRNDKLV